MVLFSKAFIANPSLKVLAYAVVVTIFSFPRFIVRKSPFMFRITTIEDKIMSGIFTLFRNFFFKHYEKKKIGLLSLVSIFTISVSFLTSLNDIENHKNTILQIQSYNLVIFLIPILYYIFKLIYTIIKKRNLP